MGKKYSNLTLFLPAGLLLVLPMVKPNQNPENKRPYRSTSRTESKVKGIEWLWEGKWRIFSLPIDLGDMKPSPKVERHLDQTVL